MKTQTRLHSVCRWTFHSGKGGFLPAGIRPAWDGSKFSSADFVRLVKKEILPRLPANTELGVELHYNNEVSETTAQEIAAAMKEAGVYLAMITPGAHGHFGYGGIASLDANERSKAAEFGQRTVDIAYGAMKDAWHKDPAKAPTFVLWNGSYGYDMAVVQVREMYSYLKNNIAELCRYEQKKGGNLYIGIEPKPNEGHPAMLLPTVASVLVLWNKLASEFGIDLSKKGVNKEFGHSEMIGLDHIYDTVEELDNDAVMHVHMNSQGYNDGIILGGPGKFDIDHGVRINAMNISIARLLQDAEYARWCGHDMQVRPYDNERQGIDRVVRSILSWEACEQAAANLDCKALEKALASRETAMAEDIMRGAVMDAQAVFNKLYMKDGV